MRTKKIIYISTLMLTLLVGARGLAQTSWDREAVLPGWHNPTQFVGGATYYHSGMVGQRNFGAVTDPTSLDSAITFTTNYTASTMPSAIASSSFSTALLPSPDRQFLIIDDTAARDPYTVGNLRCVPTHLGSSDPAHGPYTSEFTSSIRIGNNYGGADAVAWQYTMEVTSDNCLLNLYYAIVAEQPVHGSYADPVFAIRLLKEVGGEWEPISDTLSYYLVVTTNGGTIDTATNSSWHYHTERNAQYFYCDWQHVLIDLYPYLSSNVRVEVIVTDCAAMAHFAYAYIAGDVRPRISEYRACTTSADEAPVMAMPVGGQTYNWEASNMGTQTITFDIDDYRPIATQEGADANLYAVQEGDMHISRSLVWGSELVEVDSTVACQAFRCNIRTALDPDKPYTVQAYAQLCTSQILTAIDTATRCGGEVWVANRSRVVNEGDTVLPSYTEWEFYADGLFGGTPIYTSNADSLATTFDGERVGVVMRTGYTATECQVEERFVLRLKPSPTVQVVGSTHLYPGTPTDLTAVGSEVCLFQWSTTLDSVGGNLPVGAVLRTIPYADTATYYIRATSLTSGCTVWDSVLLTAYDTSRHELMNHLFAKIDIDTLVCIGDSRSVQVGHAEGNDIVVSDQHASLSHPGRVFLPDGVECGEYGCSYRSPVTFDNFANGAIVNSVNDINFVRLNIEHSYIGDLYIGITCPNGQSASLMKFSDMGTSSCTSEIPTSARGWLTPSAGESNCSGGVFLGEAYDYSDNAYCDSTKSSNAPGVGWNYCWSNSTIAGNSYAPGTGYIYRSANVSNGKIDSSNVAAQTNFYHPDQNFQSLVGCPLNGTWYIEVIDGYSGDNGYIFDWELSLTTSAIDTSIWITSSEIVGSSVSRINDSTYSLSAPPFATTDTTVQYIVLLFDSIGIVADTTVSVHYVPPTSYYRAAERCEGDTLRLDDEVFNASIHRLDTITSAIGCPYYREIDFVFHPVYDLYDTALFCPYDPLEYYGKPYDTTGDYTLNLSSVHHCDSTVHATLIVADSGFHASFALSADGERWSTDTMLAGCRPFEVMLHDLSFRATHSQWVIGSDEDTEGDSIAYTFENEGVYTISLLTTSEHGCVDTATIANAVWVFGTPKPEFSWSPTFPSTSHPTVEFFNASGDDSCSYLWLVQRADGSGRDSALAPYFTYTWETDGEPLTGDYEATLQSQKYNLTPYADTLVCYDSTTLTITIVNDWLQFPNLVTPNGDGENDTWEIVNLVEEGIYTMNELWIYNAWGSLVFHAKNINSKGDFWDPNATNSPDGAYFFHFTAKSPYGIVKYNGAIEVVRGN